MGPDPLCCLTVSPPIVGRPVGGPVCFGRAAAPVGAVIARGQPARKEHSWTRNAPARALSGRRAHRTSPTSSGPPNARARALVAADLTIAEPLHADDFELINPVGETLTKDQYLGDIASGEIDYRVWEPDSAIAVQVSGEAAVIRYRSRLEIVSGGHHVPLSHYWHTDLYELRDGRWQVVWSQATAIA